MEGVGRSRRTVVGCCRAGKSLCLLGTRVSSTCSLSVTKAMVGPGFKGLGARGDSQWACPARGRWGCLEEDPQSDVWSRAPPGGLRGCHSGRRDRVCQACRVEKARPPGTARRSTHSLSGPPPAPCAPLWCPGRALSVAEAPTSQGAGRWRTGFRKAPGPDHQSRPPLCFQGKAPGRTSGGWPSASAGPTGRAWCSGWATSRGWSSTTASPWACRRVTGRCRLLAVPPRLSAPRLVGGLCSSARRGPLTVQAFEELAEDGKCVFSLVGFSPSGLGDDGGPPTSHCSHYCCPVVGAPQGPAGGSATPCSSCTRSAESLGWPPRPGTRLEGGAARPAPLLAALSQPPSVSAGAPATVAPPPVTVRSGACSSSVGECPRGTRPLWVSVIRPGARMLPPGAARRV